MRPKGRWSKEKCDILTHAGPRVHMRVIILLMRATHSIPAWVNKKYIIIGWYVLPSYMFYPYLFLTEISLLKYPYWNSVLQDCTMYDVRCKENLNVDKQQLQAGDSEMIRSVFAQRRCAFTSIDSRTFWNYYIPAIWLWPYPSPYSITAATEKITPWEMEYCVKVNINNDYRLDRCSQSIPVVCSSYGGDTSHSFSLYLDLCPSISLTPSFSPSPMFIYYVFLEISTESTVVTKGSPASVRCRCNNCSTYNLGKIYFKNNFQKI